MDYILGIDLGTSSVGVAGYKFNKEQNTTEELIAIDSCIFDEPADNGNKERVLKNIDRRSARLIRRQISRKKRLLKKIYTFLKDHGFYENFNSKIKYDVITLRSQAVTNKLTLIELAQVFSHISKNRGYNGNITKIGEVSKNIKALKTEMEENNCITLGQLWAVKKSESIETISPWKNINATGTYTDRELIKEEFNLIYDKQLEYHDILSSEITVDNKHYFNDKYEQGDKINFRDALFHLIFFQRPLKWDTNTIGKDSYFPNELRLSKSSPAFQDFRLRKSLIDFELKALGANNRPAPLDQEQRDILYNLLISQTEVTFKKMYTSLGFSEDTHIFNFDRSHITGDKNASFKGHETNATMKTLELDQDWANLSDDEQEIVIITLANISDLKAITIPSLNSLEEIIMKLVDDSAYTLESSDLDNCICFLLKMSKHEKFETITSLGLNSGRTSYGLTTTRYVAEKSLDGIREDEAIKDLIHDYDLKIQKQIKSDLLRKLNEDDKHEITNPVVMKSLAEFRYIFNNTVKSLSKKGYVLSRVCVEMSRDMKNSLKKRNDIEKDNNINKRMRDNARKALEKDGHNPSSKDIDKYLLWQDQGKKCAYSGENIGLSALMNTNNYEIDHIIPKSRGGTNVKYNLALVTRDMNQEKGNRTPYQAFKNTKHWTAINKLSQEILPDLADEVKKEKIDMKELKDYKHKRAMVLISEKDPEEYNEFKDAQNNETAYIARFVQNWLKSVCKDVTVTRGSVTAYLRYKWGINDILPSLRHAEGTPLFNEDREIITWDNYQSYKHPIQDENGRYAKRNIKFKFDKRCDHRHHMIDAAVIAHSSTSITQKANVHNRKYGTLYRTRKWNYDDKKFDKIDEFEAEIPYDHFVSELKNKLHNFIVWHKIDFYPSGVFFGENPFSLKSHTRLEEKTVKKQTVLVEKTDSILSQRETMEKLSHKDSRPDKSGKLVKRYEKLRKKKYSNEDKPLLALTNDDLNIIFGDIVGLAIRKSIINQFQKRVKDGMDFTEALCGRNDKVDINEETEEEISITYKLDDGRPDGIYFPEHSKNRVKKVMYKQNQYREGVDVNLGHAVNLVKNYSMLIAKKDGSKWEFLPQHKYDNKIKVADDEIKIIKSMMIFHKPNKQFYIVTGLNCSNKYLECVVTNEAVSSFGKAYKSKNYANTKNNCAGMTISKTAIPDIIPIYSRRDLYNIIAEYFK